MTWLRRAVRNDMAGEGSFGMTWLGKALRNEMAEWAAGNEMAGEGGSE